MSLPAAADDFTVNAPVGAAVVYPQGATLSRSFDVSIPQGMHRILVPIPRAMMGGGPLPRVSGLGALRVGAMEVLPGYVTDPLLVQSPAQVEAQQALDAAEDQLLTARDALGAAQMEADAAAARIAFLTSVSAENVDDLEAAALQEVADMIGTQMAVSLQAQRAAMAALRGQQDAVEAAEKIVVQARQDLARQTPPQGPVNMLAITVDADAAAQAALTLTHLVRGASWRPSYELNLDRDAGIVEVARKVVVAQSTGELWSDVDLVLSTADPFARVRPQEVLPQGAFIQKRGKGGFASSVQLEADSLQRSAGPELLVEPVAEQGAALQIDGLSVTYDYPTKVSVAPGQGALILALDSFTLDAEPFNRAAPRFDQTAFLMARFVNDRSDPLLAGEAQVSRDGVFVGQNYLEHVPAGAETEVSFGPLEGIRLGFTVLDNDTGDRGLLSSSDTRTQSMEFEVENLTAEGVSVETLFALPFAEQEDLTLRVRARPEPDEIEFEQRRGVGAWAIDLGAGEKQVVKVDVDLSWPEGSELSWQP